MSDPKIVNLSALPWTTWSTSERIGVEIKDPARKVGSSHCGCACTGWRRECNPRGCTGISSRRRCS